MTTLTPYRPSNRGQYLMKFLKMKNRFPLKSPSILSLHMILLFNFRWQTQTLATVTNRPRLIHKIQRIAIQIVKPQLRTKVVLCMTLNWNLFWNPQLKKRNWMIIKLYLKMRRIRTSLILKRNLRMKDNKKRKNYRKELF